MDRQKLLLKQAERFQGNPYGEYLFGFISSMNIESLEIPDIKLISPSKFSDDRGYFMETFNQRLFNEKIKVTNFVQDNESSSSFGVLRGIHFQEPPYAQLS